MCVIIIWYMIIMVTFIDSRANGNLSGPIELKGIVHLNIIFSYIKVNKIRNLDQPVN